MSYPLNMSQAAGGGFAVANDEAEHKALTEHGYEPRWGASAADHAPATLSPDSAPAAPAAEPAADPAADEASAEDAHDRDSLRAQLDAQGISYDRRWGVERLLAALNAGNTPAA